MQLSKRPAPEPGISCAREQQSSLQNRGNFLRISGEQRQKQGEYKTSARRELHARGGSIKNPACPHTIVQAVPAFKYERGYLILTLKQGILECFSKT